MSKVTLDMSTFKALASETRLDILRTLDGKKLSLRDIERATKLNKATLHEHLQKLTEAGLVKKNIREGHKWVYYKLTWKGECLLHPDNAKIVVMFTTSFIALAVGIIELINFVKGHVMSKVSDSGIAPVLEESSNKSISFPQENISIEPHFVPHLGTQYNEEIANTSNVLHDPILQWIGVICIAIFCILFVTSVYKLHKNRKPKL